MAHKVVLVLIKCPVIGVCALLLRQRARRLAGPEITHSAGRSRDVINTCSRPQASLGRPLCPAREEGGPKGVGLGLFLSSRA